MRPCSENQSRIIRYLDDELPGWERAALESHLRRCARCRRAAADASSFLDTVRSRRPAYRAPITLRSRVESIIQDVLPSER